MWPTAAARSRHRRALAYILRMRTVPLRNLGACIAPDNSWMFLQGIEHIDDILADLDQALTASTAR